MLAAAATFTRNPEEATLMRNLRLGTMVDTTGGTKLGQKVPGAILQVLTDLHVDFLIVVALRSLTGESMNFGSGVVTNICRLR